MVDLIDIYTLDNVTANDPLKVTTNDGTIIWEKTFWVVIYAIDWQGNRLGQSLYLFDIAVNGTNQPLQSVGTVQESSDVEIRRYNEDNLTISVAYQYGKTYINNPVRISTSLPTGASSGYGEGSIQFNSLMGDKVIYALSKAYFSVTITSVDSDGAIRFRVSRVASGTSNVTFVFSGTYYLEDSSGNWWRGNYYGTRTFRASSTQEDYVISPETPFDYDAPSSTPSNVYYYEVNIGQSETSTTWRVYGFDDGYR